MENYTKFVENIHTFGQEYNKNFSTFQGPLPKPLKCPYPGSCKGGINSACNVGYQGTLCATCSTNYYLRFNSCLQCPRMVVTIISCLMVIVAFALLFVVIFRKDSVKVRRHTEDDGNARPEDDGNARSDDDGKARSEDNINARTENNGNARLEDDGNARPGDDGNARLEDDGNVRTKDDADACTEDDGSVLTKDDADACSRTVADVIMSCAKIVIGFYQVVAGVFSALVRVRWPIILIHIEKCLTIVEGNILQFAPLRCIHPLLGLDPFQQFVAAIAINAAIVFLICLYLFLKKWYINRMEEEEEEKQKKMSELKRSCYRNIFLFLLLSYPVTSKKIIGIVPLGGVCVKKCFTEDGTECVSLLKADYSIHCFTHRHNVFWPIAAAFALCSVFFPFLLGFLIYKYRHNKKPHPNPSEIAFGLRVFCENYKEKYWYWEIVEMYRKLSLISFILLIDSESPYQIGFAVIVASASGIVYTIFRPIKDPFEDRLQTFVLWVTFFNVCLGAIYLQPDDCRNQAENKSVLVNAVFLVLNGAVLCSTVLQWRPLSKSSALKVTRYSNVQVFESKLTLAYFSLCK